MESMSSVAEESSVDTSSSNVSEVSDEANGSGIDQNNATEEAAEKGVDAKAESKVVSTDECSKEFDEYVFSYWNNRKQSNEREASHFF